MKKLLLPLFFICCTIVSSYAQIATLTPMLEFDGAAITSISENGEWACGSTFNNNDGAGYQSNASKWNLATGERTYLVSEDELDNAQSDAFAITNDGSLVVGQYLLLPAYYINGEWHTLELTKGYTIGEARDVAIVNGDTIIVGRIFDSTGYQRVQGVTWVNGKLNQLNKIIPREYQYNEDNNMATQITGISEDGRVMLGAYDPFTWPLRKPFIIKDSVFTLLAIDTTAGLADYYANVDFFKEEKLNHNGEYVALSFFGHNIHRPVVYNTTDNKFTLINEAPVETGAKAVDNNGNVYYAGPTTSGIDRKSFVSINGQAIQVDNILMDKFGITQEQINATCTDPDLTGSIRFIYDVAADGKTIIGSAGYGTGGYNWVLKLQYPLFDAPDAIENITYNNLAAYYENNNIHIIGNPDYIELYDISGKLILQSNISTSAIPANLKNGIYVVKLHNTQEDKVTTSKLIVK